MILAEYRAHVPWEDTAGVDPDFDEGDGAFKSARAAIKKWGSIEPVDAVRAQYSNGHESFEPWPERQRRCREERRQRRELEEWRAARDRAVLRFFAQAAGSYSLSEAAEMIGLTVYQMEESLRGMADRGEARMVHGTWFLVTQETSK